MARSSRRRSTCSASARRLSISFPIVRGCRSPSATCSAATPPPRPPTWRVACRAGGAGPGGGPAPAPPLIRRLAARCDLVKVSDDELPALVDTGDPRDGARALRSLGAKLVIVTLGARGCWFDAPAGSSHVPGEAVRAVDATGAGDAF